jgi:hypothetical protein
MGTKADVPEDDTKMINAAVIPPIKVGVTMAWNPRSTVPGGANAGVSWIPTAMTRVNTATSKVTTPIQAAIPICESLGNKASAVEKMNATRANQTVQAPWFDRALRAVATPIYPLPATRVYLLLVSERLSADMVTYPRIYNTPMSSRYHLPPTTYAMSCRPCVLSGLVISFVIVYSRAFQDALT